MVSKNPVEPEKPALWPALWIPLLILVAGLVVTAIAANTGAGISRDLAEARYHTQHYTLVNRLLAAAPSFNPDINQPANWLSSLFDQAVPVDLGLRIDTLERHTKQPLFQIHVSEGIDPTLALRTEVPIDHTRWMLTTRPGPLLLENAAKQTRIIIWTTGLIFSALASFLALLLCHRLHKQSLQISNQSKHETSANQQITNLQVEKSILHQALTDSEQRSRDLIALSGAIIFELDESGLIGFASPQIADLLDYAPADLTGQPFDALIAPSSRDNMNLAMSACRAEQSVHRVDLPLLRKGAENSVAVVLRIRALQDTVHGFIGYRVSALPHSAEPA